MSKFYNEMREMCGSKNVWIDDNKYNKNKRLEYCFSMNDVLMSNEEESFEFEKRCEGNENIECMVGYGDDIMNCIIVVDVEKLDEVEKKFIEEYCGSNCYSE